MMKPAQPPAPPPRTARRRLLRTLAGASVAVPLAWPLGSRAAEPPLRLLVGFPPGGGTDAIARLLADKLQPLLGRTVLVDNRAGAGGQLAAQALKAAVPDGHTLLLSHDHTVSILPLVLKNPGFDPEQDFIAVAGFASFANAMALSSSTPAPSLPAFLAWVRQKQASRGTVGVPALASVPEFLVQALARQARLDLVAVPYRGSAPMLQDMIGGQIPAGVGSVPDFIDHHHAGRVRIVAVMGRSRQDMLPEVPTLAESGLPGFEALPYYGLFAPAGTPRTALLGVVGALEKALEQPVLRERLTALGLTVALRSAAELTAYERSHRAGWARLIRASGFVPQ
jgi:tripartite-type tricarboxylate transporter receptor subunit TctC